LPQENREKGEPIKAHLSITGEEKDLNTPKKEVGKQFLI